MKPLFVFCNCPDEASANSIGLALIEARLAACVNLLPRVQSIYRWQGAIETAAEVPLLIKTTRARYAELQDVLAEAHPYELPEIIAVPVGSGLPGYLDWIAAEVTAGP